MDCKLNTGMNVYILMEEASIIGVYSTRAKADSAYKARYLYLQEKGDNFSCVALSIEEWGVE